MSTVQTAARIAAANEALLSIGANSITDFNSGSITGSADTSAEAIAIGTAYDTAQNAFLVDNPWTFARTRVKPTEITYSSTTPSAWVTSHAYALADRVLRGGFNYVCLVAHTSGTFATDLAAGDWILAASDLTVTFDNIRVVYALPSDFLALYQISQAAIHQIEFWTLQGTKTKVMLSDSAGLGIVYIFQNADPSTYFPKARQAFIKRLAAEITLYLSSANKTRLQLMTEYDSVDLPQAQAKDSQQGTPNAPDQFDWERARFFGTGPIFPPNPGAQTWITVWSY